MSAESSADPPVFLLPIVLVPLVQNDCAEHSTPDPKKLDQEVLPGRAPAGALATARATAQCDLTVVHNNITNRSQTIHRNLKNVP